MNERYSRFALWINRLVLAAASFIFTMIGMRYILDPVHAAAATGAVLSSGFAAASTRVGFGAFPLAFAIFSLLCLSSARRLKIGVSLVAIVVATAIVVRLVSVFADGPAPESLRLFVPEALILLLSVTGLALDGARPKQQPAA